MLSSSRENLKNLVALWDHWELCPASYSLRSHYPPFLRCFVRISNASRDMRLRLLHSPFGFPSLLNLGPLSPGCLAGSEFQFLSSHFCEMMKALLSFFCLSAVFSLGFLALTHNVCKKISQAEKWYGMLGPSQCVSPLSGLLQILA